MSAIEPKLAVRASWVSILCSFVLSADTWVKLAELAGFSPRVSWAMVGVVDAYVISALVLWTFTTNKELARFARKNTYCAALVGVAAQAGYHGWQAGARHAAVIVVALAIVIGAIPPAFAAVGIHMRSIGVMAARTGTDTDKLTAGLLSLSLMHGAADTAIKLSALRTELAAMTAARVTPAVTPDTAKLLSAVSVMRAETDTDRPASRLIGTSKRSERLSWLADNPTAGVADIVLHFGVTERTAFRDIESLKANQA